MNRSLRRSVVLGAILALFVGSSLAQAHTSSFSIDRDAYLSPGGTSITVSGRITCGVAHTFQIQVTVTQGDGQNAETAQGFTDGTCLGTPQLWEVQAQSFTGPFHSGKATASGRAVTFGGDGFHEAFTDRQVHLR